jgi:alpha-N-arabinofuranosidase
MHLISRKVQSFSIDGADKLSSQGSVTLLRGNSLQAVNSLDNPTAVSPVTKPVELNGKQLDLALDPYSFSVIRVSMQ